MTWRHRERAVAFSSGMGAAAGLLFHRLASGDHLVVSDEAYAGVAELVRDTLAKLKIEVSPADLADQAMAAGSKP